MLHRLGSEPDMIRKFMSLLVLLALSGLATGQEITMRPEITGTHGIVAAGRHYSVAAGVRRLEQGGNAIDAGAAAVFAAAVVEISHFGLGGEAPALVYVAKEKRSYAINGQGTAPAGATPDLFRPLGKIDSNGPRSLTVPAVVDSMVLALQRFGTMRLEQVLQPAIEFADGFAMYGFLEGYLRSEQKASEPYADTMATYYPGGKVTPAGAMFRQPNLAITLRALVAAEKAEFARSRDRAAALAAGRDAFYKGPIARRIADADRKAGGLLSYDDLAQYRGKVEEPVSTEFHGYTVLKCGFWNQGPVLLQALNILEGYDLREMGLHSTEYIHTVAEAVKLAYDDRDTFYGDPDFARVPARGLLSKEYAAARRSLISRQRAALEHRPGDPYAFDPAVPRPERRYVPTAPAKTGPAPANGDTTCVNVVDREGNLFSVTPSSGWLLGGAFIAGDTGVPLGNRLQAFSLHPDSPNVLAPGKRPRTTLSPTLVLKQGKPFLAVSTPGADTQDQQILNFLLNVFVFDLPIQRALEAPRINSLHLFATLGVQTDNPGVLEVESRVAPGVLEALRQKGHKIVSLQPYGVSTGVTAVGVDPVHGTLRGGSDVRRERYIFGW
jgi:gamma-glutamyltranspeptidase/glutathione hydrolase